MIELIPYAIYKVSWDALYLYFKYEREDFHGYHGIYLNDLTMEEEGPCSISKNDTLAVFTQIGGPVCPHKFVEVPMFTSTYSKCEKCGETR